MDHPIKKDQNRFKKIVQGKLRQNLKKFISKGELPIPKGGTNGKDVFKIPMPQIQIPRFKFGENQDGGAGQGQGEPGDPIQGQPKEGQGSGDGEAGENEGQKELEVHVTLDELAQILGEELALPKIEAKGKKSLPSESTRYTSIGTSGPDSLKHFKRSFKEALKRSIATGHYNPQNPIIIPHRADFRYRSAAKRLREEFAAVVIYMMDVSGSMGEEQKEIVRTESFWINLWLKSQYKNMEIRYIIHDATAREVDEETFFRTRESGGTLISSAYRICADMILKDYNPEEVNIYPFHFSDGDNWSSEDTSLCMTILDEEILPYSNVFCYGQVESRYGSGQFLKDLEKYYPALKASNKKISDSSKNLGQKIITSQIKDKSSIMKSIQDFLGKGK